jgi:peptidoglycan hydrolase CwlO-like protein
MTQEKKINYILIGLLVLAAILIVASFANRKPSGVDYREIIKAKDETIQAEKEKQAIYEDHIEELKSVIDELNEKDSVLITKISTNRQTIKQVDDKLKNIPASIDALDKDAIRRAISNL